MTQKIDASKASALIEPAREENRAVRAHEIAKEHFGGLDAPSVRALSTWQFQGVSLGNILLLYAELMKLDIFEREQEKKVRREVRNCAIGHMEEVEANFKGLGKTLLQTSIVGGLLGLVGPFGQAVGYMKGDEILSRLSSLPLLGKLAGMDKGKFFNQVLPKMTQTMADTSNNMSKIQETYPAAPRTRSEKLGQLAQTDEDGITREIADRNQKIAEQMRALLEAIESMHQAAISTYR